MITATQIEDVIETMTNSNKFATDEEMLAYVNKRLKAYSEHTMTGYLIANQVEAGERSFKCLLEITDEEFTTLVFDFRATDKDMARIFNVSKGVIAKRRAKLNIESDSINEGPLKMLQWVKSERVAPDLEEFLTSIAA